jgi:hypothetical protein
MRRNFIYFSADFRGKFIVRRARESFATRLSAVSN